MLAIHIDVDHERRRCDGDIAGIEAREHVAADRILELADCVITGEEPDRELDPVIGQAQKDLGFDVELEDEIAAHQLFALALAELLDVLGVTLSSVAKNAFCALAVGPVRDRDRDLLPQERKLARVVVDGSSKTRALETVTSRPV